MPKYEYTIIYVADTPDKTIKAVNFHERTQNQVIPQSITAVVQGNEYTIKMTRFDGAKTSKEANDEFKLDLLQHFMSEIDPGIFDLEKNWEVKKETDLDIYPLINNMICEIM